MVYFEEKALSSSSIVISKASQSGLDSTMIRFQGMTADENDNASYPKYTIRSRCVTPVNASQIAKCPLGVAQKAHLHGHASILHLRCHHIIVWWQRGCGVFLRNSWCRALCTLLLVSKSISPIFLNRSKWLRARFYKIPKTWSLVCHHPVRSHITR